MELNKGIVIASIAAVVVCSLITVSALIVDLRIGSVVAIICIIALFSTYKTHIKPVINYKTLLKTGIHCHGVIITVSETGNWMNNEPICKIEIDVEIPGETIYKTSFNTVISFLKVSEFEVGKRIPLIVDSKDKMNVQFTENKSSSSVINEM